MGRKMVNEGQELSTSTLLIRVKWDEKEVKKCRFLNLLRPIAAIQLSKARSPRPFIKTHYPSPIHPIYLKTNQLATLPSQFAPSRPANHREI